MAPCDFAFLNRRKSMFKKILVAATATAIVAGATLTVPVTAQAAMTCKEAAKMKYPDNHKMRHAFKKSCKDAWKASQ
jgi:hypothetical protein